MKNHYCSEPFCMARVEVNGECCEEHDLDNKLSRIETATREIIELVKQHNEELAYDCERILDKYSWT
ncbi:hypothetical protein WKH57_01145 [Niallia taxi]|uniref:hypothetical protein n=1 Tax=Niallia taxi TaxID=2499688 RepID=UPI00316E567F